MVHWRNFISSRTEIDPVAERFVKRVIFDCLNLNRYILVQSPVQSVFLRNIGNALNIISFEFYELIQMCMDTYPLERLTVQSHMTFLHEKLKLLYNTCRRDYPRELSYYIVLAVALEVIYFIWAEMPQMRKKELTYATECILARLFSSREFTTHCSLGQFTAYAYQIIREHFDLYCYFRNNIESPYQHPPQRPTNLNFLDDIPTPDDRYSPDSPISAASWLDSGVSVPSEGFSTATTSRSSSSGYATPSSAELLLPIAPPPMVHLPAIPHPEVERHILRRFLPQRGRLQYISRFMPRFRFFRRLRRFTLALSRSL